MLKTEMSGGIGRTTSLVATGIGNTHHHTAVFGLAAHEAVAKYTGLVADDLESECPYPPFGRLAWVRRLNMDVIDPEGHEGLLTVARDQLAGLLHQAYHRANWFAIPRRLAAGDPPP